MAENIIKIKKADTIGDVYYAVGNGRPLLVEEMDRFYYDTDEVRSNISARWELADIIRKNAAAEINGHIVFVGAKGAGKSTELNHLEKDILKDILVINYSVMQELDPQNISYIELFIVTMQKLFKYAEVNNLDIPEQFLDRIIDWTNTTEIKEIKEKHLSGEASAGFSGKIGIPYLKEFFFKLQGTAKASKSFKETLTNTIEPRLSELIAFCNELLSEIRIRIKARGKDDILIIIEDLDKIPKPVAHDLFINHAYQLVLLKANIIYTYPVALYYHTSFNNIINFFSDVIELPMVKIRNIDGTEYEKGIVALRQLVHNRINKALFTTEEILDRMILITGGVLRDLFRMIKDAAAFAESRGGSMIGSSEYEYAYKKLKKEYRNTIADYSENGVSIKAEDFYKELNALLNNSTKNPNNTDTLLQLRQNLCVLTYNGDGWSDVHPVVKDILRER